MLLAALAMVATLAVPSLAAAERVGVVVAVSVNLEEDASQRLANRLGRALRQRLRVDVIAGAEAARRLPREGVSDACVVEAACLRELGKRLGADQLLLLAVIRVGDSVQIDPTWVEVASGKTAARERIAIEGRDAPVDEIFAAAAPLLLPDARVRGPVDAEQPERVRAEPPGTVRAVARPARARHATAGVWIAGGVSAAALVASGVLGVDTYRKYGDLEAMGCDRVLCDAARIDEVDSRALTADILLGVGVVAGVSAVLLYAYSGGEAEAAQRIGLGAAGDGFTFTYGGRF